jgi:GTP-binding protein HflX
MDVLEDLGADDKPVVMALNKIDQIDPEVHGSLEDLIARLPLKDEQVVPISGATGYNLEALMAAVEAELEDLERFVPVTAVIPYAETTLVDHFHKVGRVESIDYVERGTVIRGLLPEAELTRFGSRVTIEGGALTPERSMKPETGVAPHSAA